jgi:hypothetical protein
LAGAFFAVAITFLLDQVAKTPLCIDAMSLQNGNPPPETAQEGRPGAVNPLADRCGCSDVSLLVDPLILICHHDLPRL